MGDAFVKRDRENGYRNSLQVHLIRTKYSHSRRTWRTDESLRVVPN